jgi:hypothetical protein
MGFFGFLGNMIILYTNSKIVIFVDDIDFITPSECGISSNGLRFKPDLPCKDVGVYVLFGAMRLPLSIINSVAYRYN